MITEITRQKLSQSHQGQIAWNKGLKGWKKSKRNPDTIPPTNVTIYKCSKCGWDVWSRKPQITGSTVCERCGVKIITDVKKDREYRIRFKEYNKVYQKRQNHREWGTGGIIRTGICSICKTSTKPTTIHHLIPRYLTDDDSGENLIECCRSCHRSMENFTINFLAGNI